MRQVLMKGLKYLPAAVLAILLVFCVVAYYSTRMTTAPAAKQQSAAAEAQPVNTGLLETAIGLATLAATPDEQVQAHEAWRLSDQELDLHYAGAMIDAQEEAS